MAKKSHHYTEMSTKTCNAVVDTDGKGYKVYCGKRIKQRLVEQKQPHNITKCYKHRDQV